VKYKAMHCAICSHRGEFIYEPGAPARDNYRCANCRAMTRQRDVAQLILDEFADGMHLDLRSLVESGGINDLDIYEVGIKGPIAARLKPLPKYVQSYYWEDIPAGEEKNGIQCQDLRSLTFRDDSYDLIISLEIFEHVFDAEKALREIHRVLKPGGVHIFSMPVKYPFPKSSEVRAKLSHGEIEHLMPARYHVAGDGSESLVVTDWGHDFVDLHKKVGLKLSVVRRSAPAVGALANASFVARKISVK